MEQIKSAQRKKMDVGIAAWNEQSRIDDGRQRARSSVGACRHGRGTQSWELSGDVCVFARR